MGRLVSARRSVGESLEEWERLPKEPPPEWCSYLTPAEIDCLAANAYTEMAFQQVSREGSSYVGLAERHALHALEGRDGHYVRSRVLDTIRLANVRLAQREVEEAAAVAGQAVEMSADLTSTIVLDRLAEFQQRLSPVSVGLPEVEMFQDRLKTHLGRQVDGWS
jgi:hypothetical protein